MIDEKKLIEAILEHKDKIKSCDKRVDEVYELAHDHIIDIINIQPKTDWITCEVEMPKDETLMYWTTHEDGSGNVREVQEVEEDNTVRQMQGNSVRSVKQYENEENE